MRREHGLQASDGSYILVVFCAGKMLWFPGPCGFRAKACRGRAHEDPVGGLQVPSPISFLVLVEFERENKGMLSTSCYRQLFGNTCLSRNFHCKH